jgi:3-oxoacyl-[acyl-carrier-protein] synthase II
VTAIAITGIGVVAPNGHSLADFWANSLAGVSGVRRLGGAADPACDVEICGHVRDFDPSAYVTRREQLLYDATQINATAAACMALDDAGPSVGTYEPERMGVVIGTGAGPLNATCAAVATLASQGQAALSPYYVPAATVSFCASLPARVLGARGPALGVSASCATAAYCLIAGAQLIAADDADVVLAGATDSAAPTMLAGFANLRALAHHDDPARASRPLDLERMGFVLSEGAAVFVLERAEVARRRNARIYATLVGYAMTGDAGDIIAAEPDGIARACRQALRKAKIGPGDVDHINLHAAGTRQGDLAEALAIREVFGPRAASIPVTAPKSMLGHALGVASGLETALLLKTLETGSIPPTINLETPDPEIGLNASAQSVKADMRTALKTALGVGGVNAALLFVREDRQVGRLEATERGRET